MKNTPDIGIVRSHEVITVGQHPLYFKMVKYEFEP